MAKKAAIEPSRGYTFGVAGSTFWRSLRQSLESLVKRKTTRWRKV